MMKIEETVGADRRLTLDHVDEHFRDISSEVFRGEIAAETLGCRKPCARRIPKMLTRLRSCSRGSRISRTVP